jgi:hypothetical protein
MSTVSAEATLNSQPMAITDDVPRATSVLCPAANGLPPMASDCFLKHHCYHPSTPTTFMGHTQENLRSPRDVRCRYLKLCLVLGSCRQCPTHGADATTLDGCCTVGGCLKLCLVLGSCRQCPTHGSDATTLQGCWTVGGCAPR